MLMHPWKKNGKVIKDKTYELSWGVGDYGDHTYIVQYKVINFIKQLKDSQMLFWRFVNDKTNAPPEKVTLEIEADKAFEKSSEKIWAFGYEGDINFSDGKVYASSDEALTDKNYVTVLMRLPDETYGTFDQIDKTFDEIKEEAFEGSDYGKSNERQSTLFSIFEDYIILALLLCAAAFVVYFIIKKSLALH